MRWRRLRVPGPGVRVPLPQVVEQTGQDGQFEADLLAGLPPGLVAAVPGVAVPVLFVAASQARAGRSSRELVHMLGLSLHDAKTILAPHHRWQRPTSRYVPHGAAHRLRFGQRV
jgi:hypothetical protein